MDSVNANSTKKVKSYEFLNRNELFLESPSYSKKPKAKQNLPKDVAQSTESVDQQGNLPANKKQAPAKKNLAGDQNPDLAKQVLDTKTAATGAENLPIPPSAQAIDSATPPATSP